MELKRMLTVIGKTVAEMDCCLVVFESRVR